MFDDAAFLPSQVIDNPNPEETFPNRLSSDVALEEQTVNAQLLEPSAGCSYQQEQPSQDAPHSLHDADTSQIRRAPFAVTPE